MTSNTPGEPNIISEGHRWALVDLLDDTVIVEFSDWDVPNPEQRAWEMYKTYPREAYLYKQKVVIYEKECVAQPARFHNESEEIQNDRDS